jgi:hypothetical protein
MCIKKKSNKNTYNTAKGSYKILLVRKGSVRIYTYKNILYMTENSNTNHISIGNT